MPSSNEPPYMRATFVLVSGPGAVGLLTMLLAKLEGARVVVAGIDQRQSRLALAKELGADLVVDTSSEDVLECSRPHPGRRRRLGV